MQPITLVLADDHKLVRQGLRALLDAQEDLEVVGEASDGKEALKMIESLFPDIALLDVMMPNLNGIEVARLLRERGSKTKTIFLSMHSNATYVVRALHSGALAYVLKDSDFSEILQAIHNALAGKRYLSVAIADEVFEMLLNADTEKIDSLDVLSPREREILHLIAEGNTNTTIAEKLSLSVRTIESHRAHIMSKLRFSSQADLIRFAVQKGLILP
jgi:DNA-binding NarL/FixJ family response regulator